VKSLEWAFAYRSASFVVTSRKGEYSTPAVDPLPFVLPLCFHHAEPPNESRNPKIGRFARRIDSEAGACRAGIRKYRGPPGARRRHTRPMRLMFLQSQSVARGIMRSFATHAAFAAICATHRWSSRWPARRCHRRKALCALDDLASNSLSRMPRGDRVQSAATGAPCEKSRKTPHRIPAGRFC
jgi:hypothetical protein